MDERKVYVDGRWVIDHLMEVDKNGAVYCYLHDKKEVLTSHFYNESCFKCPYLFGANQGRGVECAYNEGDPQNIKGTVGIKKH